MSHSNGQTPIRERWTARPAGEGDEDTAGALLRAAAEHGPVAEKRLADIHARLRRSRQPRAFARLAPRLLRQLVFAAGFVLCGGVLSASVMHVMRRPPKPEVVPAPAIESKGRPAKRAPGNHRPADSLTPSEAPETPAPPLTVLPPPAAPVGSVPRSLPEAQASASAARFSSPHRRVAIKESPVPVPIAAPIERPVPPTIETRTMLAPSEPSPLPAPAAVPNLPSAKPLLEQVLPMTVPVQASFSPAQPEPSRLARESRWLAGAIAKLRQEGQPEQALAILDQHRSELSSGALASEVNATRIEALLRLGRNGQALVLLDGQRLSAHGMEREMLVARAELRADKGRTSAAVRDFDLILSSPGRADGVTERALYGRATCRAKSGDWEGARGDFAKYLEAFPQGRFAPGARSALSQQLR